MDNIGTVTNVGFGQTGPVNLTGGSSKFRMIIRDGALVVDKTLTALGFSGVESTDQGVTGDWVNVFKTS